MNDSWRLWDGGHTEKAWDILHLDLELLLFWQIEKSFTLRDDILNQGLVNTSVLDIEEANFEQGSSKRLEERRLGPGISCKGEVENWNRAE